MLDTLYHCLPGFSVRPITEGNWRDFAVILESNRDFFMLTEGKPATPGDCRDNMYALPPGFDISRKFYFGIEKDGKALALIDLLADYPSEGSVWIGWFLVRGESRGRGIGGGIIGALVRAFAETGYKSAQLGVVSNNAPALRFWARHGFVKIREAAAPPSIRDGLNVIVMERKLTSIL